jgi:hypothetical protein
MKYWFIFSIKLLRSKKCWTSFECIFKGFWTPPKQGTKISLAINFFFYNLLDIAFLCYSFIIYCHNLQHFLCSFFLSELKLFMFYWKETLDLTSKDYFFLLWYQWGMLHLIHRIKNSSTSRTFKLKLFGKETIKMISYTYHKSKFNFLVIWHIKKFIFYGNPHRFKCKSYLIKFCFISLHLKDL